MNAWRAFLSNGPAMGVLLRRSRRRNRVLLYHRVVGDDCPPALRALLAGAITRSAFERQLDHLAETYRVVGLREFMARRSEPAGLAAITFDDGYADNLWNALPALRARNLPATVFVATAFIGRPDGAWWDRLARQVAARPGEALRLDAGDGPREFAAAPPGRIPNGCGDWLRDLPPDMRDVAVAPLPKSQEDRFLTTEEIRELEAGGMEVQAHTVHHPRLADLPAEAAKREIADCRPPLEAAVAHPVDMIAYPFGERDDFSDDHRRYARECGYRAAFAAYRATVDADTDPFAVPRVPTCQDFDRFRLRLARL